MKYLTIILISLYFIANGAVEGYTWADSGQRIENVIIKGGAEGNGILDYHGFRTIELSFILFASCMILGLGGLGASMIGLFTYERILNQVINNCWFKEAGWEYYICGITIKRYMWQDFTVLIIGIILLGYYFIMKQRSTKWIQKNGI